MQQEDEPYLGHFEKLNIHLFQHILRFLSYKEKVKMRCTNSKLRDQINFKVKEDHRLKDEVFASNDDIKLYISVFLPKEFNTVHCIKVYVQTRDQGWSSANYSSSWVTLQLIHANDAEFQKSLTLHRLEDIKEELIVAENFSQDYHSVVERYEYGKLYIIDGLQGQPMYKNGEYEKVVANASAERINSFFDKLNDKLLKKYVGVALILKCQYPGWQCRVKSAKVQIIYD